MRWIGGSVTLMLIVALGVWSGMTMYAVFAMEVSAALTAAGHELAYITREAELDV
jgi:hypothetical protein